MNVTLCLVMYTVTGDRLILIRFKYEILWWKQKQLVTVRLKELVEK
jgi:hypothetical protein